MLPDDIEPVRIDCQAIAAAGLWEQSDCCEACHRNVCSTVAVLEHDLGPGGETGRVRLRLCCAASSSVNLPAVLKLRG